MDAINDMPIREVGGATVYMRDVAQVHDGSAVQSNIVRQDGRRSTVLSILKSGGSTLDIVKRVKAALPRIMTTLPSQMTAKPLFDQSLFVRAAIDGVVREAVISAVLTGLMILLFLGSWRSTLIVCISIPLSILTSIIVLYLLDQTINVMTLGGLAPAVGILVDDATVEIENIHRNLGQQKSLIRAILDGAQQIAVPAFVSTLAICIVFVPVVLLTGAAKYLFTPLAMAVVFAMLASYLLSRTLIPTMVKFLLPSELEAYSQDEHGHEVGGTGFIWNVHHVFNRGFEKLRQSYSAALDWSLHYRPAVIILFGVFTVGSAFMAPTLGQHFFPLVDAGQIRLHVRGPAGMRVESTEQLKAAQSAISTGEANVARLLEIQSFQKVRAPYTGVITLRNITLGTLVSAGSSAVRELYRITQMDLLKIMVSVLQSEVAFIHDGLECAIQVKELPGQTFSAKVTRTANSLDAASRTLLTEIQFRNPGRKVLPGHVRRGQIHHAPDQAAAADSERRRPHRKGGNARCADPQEWDRALSECGSGPGQRSEDRSSNGAGAGRPDCDESNG